MSDDEINREIAEICGWKIHPANRNLVTDPKYPHSVQPIGTIPDYCNDLNAMHDAENWIIANKSSLWLFQDYAQNLRKNFQTLGLDGYIHSTARQRAEAFLRTIGKWKEEAK
jgi:hypothetical protein